MKLFDVVTVDQALEIMKNEFNSKLKIQNLDLIDALDRYIASDLKSMVDVPHFKKSTVDGYSILFEDIFMSSDSNPMNLILKGESHMGKVCETVLEDETCVYTPTGAMVPINAQGVVMIEHSEKLNDREILIKSPVAFNENIVQIGEDIKSGEILYKKGHKINERDLGVLAGANIKKVDVYEKLVVGIISTGDEILNIDEDISDAKIKDINAYILYGQLKKAGLSPKIYSPIKDDLDKIINLMDIAINECDIVLISGGSSVGKKDETLKAIKSFKDNKVFVEGISMKPGKPTIIASINKKMVIGLPGHPLSCAFVIEALFKPYIYSLYNFENIKYKICEFKYNYHKAQGKTEYIGVNIKEEDKKLICIPVFSKSSTIKQFAKCDGYIKIERNLEGIKNGELVKVYMF